MKKIEFIKCHGSGNDFILINNYNYEYNFSNSFLKNLSKNLCDRKGLIGADGILILSSSTVGDVKMTMYNPDGTEAEMCGNGIRCIARLGSEILNLPNLIIETKESIYDVKKEKHFRENIPVFSVLIDTVSLDTKDLPSSLNSNTLLNNKVPQLSTKYNFSAISLSNPHLVSIVDKINESDLKALGYKANTLKNLFFNGINISFTKIIDKNSIFVSTFERGAGMTYSCGTGMAASSLICYILGFIDSEPKVNVYNRGGLVKTKPYKDKNNNYKVKLLGNAMYVYKADIEVDDKGYLNDNEFNGVAFKDEIESYDQFKKSLDINLT